MFQLGAAQRGRQLLPGGDDGIHTENVISPGLQVRNPGTDEEPGPAKSCEELLGELRTQQKFPDLDLRAGTAAGYIANVIKCNLLVLMKIYLLFLKKIKF